MGLGKTLTAISVMEAFGRNKARNCKSMVVCPSSLVDNWAKELSRWATYKIEAIIIKPGNDAVSMLTSLNLGPKYTVVVMSYEVTVTFQSLHHLVSVSFLSLMVFLYLIVFADVS